jgi:hypothetical protein
MRMRRRVVTGAQIAVLCLSLTGCYYGGVTLPKDNLPRCTSTIPSSVPVEALAHQTCDLTGAALVFPDGYTVHAPPPGALSSGETCHAKSTPNPSGKVVCSGKYYAGNLGSWGVVAWHTSHDGKHTTYWGTAIAIKKEKEAG